MSTPQDRTADIKGLQRVRKRTLRVIGRILLLFAIFLGSRWPAGSLVHEAMIWIGVLLIAIAICGRTWAVAHIGGRKRWEFVSDGPYSVVRHPLYAFSILGAAGASAQSASLAIMIATVLAVWMVLDRMARIEEADMAARFGEPYRSYLARTPRFVPKPSLWNAAAGLPMDHALVRKGFYDSSLFALAVPLFMALRWAHEAHLIPVLYQLP
jgi:protein-S-isoprenylcysteine O-methyltransferase Ste14